MKMNRNLTLLVICPLIVLVVSNLSLCDVHQTSAVQENLEVSSTLKAQSARARFHLPKLFDFSRFKQMFRKTYGYVENLIRNKIYLAQAFRVFLSSLSYKYRKQTYYLAINHMSDWTSKELNSMRMRLEDLPTYKSAAKRHENAIPLASEVEIKQTLVQLIEQRQQPDLGEAVKKELKLVSEVNARTKRDASSDSKSIVDLEKLTPIREEKQEEETHSSDVKLNSLEEELNNFAEEKQKKPEVTSDNLESLVERIEDDWYEKKNVLPSMHLPDEVYTDWRKRAPECYQAIRDQDQCNSCYVFVAIAMFEWHYCRMTGQSKAFSEQYVVDCGHKVGLENCNPSPFPYVPLFVTKYGLKLRSHYPYVAPTVNSDQCPNENADVPSSGERDDGPVVRVFGGEFEDVHFDEVEELLKREPVVVIVRTSQEFNQYGGGVHSGETCDPNSLHGMVLIGSGREDGEEYWLFRNSYSERWGEGGHYKLNKKATHCFHCEYAAKLTPFTIKEGEEEVSR